MDKTALIMSKKVDFGIGRILSTYIELESIAIKLKSSETREKLYHGLLYKFHNYLKLDLFLQKEINSNHILQIG